MSVTKVKEYIGLGVIPRGCTLDRAREGYIRHVRAEKGGVTAERRRLDAAKADVEEMKAHQLRGELVPADALDRTLIGLATMASGALQAIGARLAPELAAAGSRAECEQLVARAIDEALHDLADAGAEAAKRSAA